LVETVTRQMGAYDISGACLTVRTFLDALTNWRSPLRRHRDWLAAARTGLADPQLAAAALACFTVALDALHRRGVGARVQQAVAAFIERYVARGACPADDPVPPATFTEPALG
ncbi:hypothetical protein AB0H87_16880, partial [Asanoa sp. NPDC050611]